MRSAASRLDVEYEAVRKAKSMGCVAFNHNGRVDCDILSDFFLEHPDLTDPVDESDEERLDVEVEEALKIRADRVWKEERTAILREDYMPMVYLRRFIARGVLKAKGVLLGKPQSIGLKVSAKFGCDAVGVEQIVAAEMNEICEILSKFELKAEEGNISEAA